LFRAVKRGFAARLAAVMVEGRATGMGLPGRRRDPVDQIIQDRRESEVPIYII
jgi:hypothetical protein